MYIRIFKGFAVLAAVVALSACESTSGVKEPESTVPSSTESTGSVSTSGAASTVPSSTESTGSVSTSGAASTGTSGFQGSPLDDPASLLSNRTVYFEFDSSEITGPDRPVIEAHGRYLADNPGAAVTLEGHADERGSREYNIALGERRANAVRELMTLLGASGSQLRVVSYGEERPAVEGHDESAWSRNRRVEIIYRSR